MSDALTTDNASHGSSTQCTSLIKGTNTIVYENAMQHDMSGKSMSGDGAERNRRNSDDEDSATLGREGGSENEAQQGRKPTASGQSLGCGCCDKANRKL